MTTFTVRAGTMQIPLPDRSRPKATDAKAVQAAQIPLQAPQRLAVRGGQPPRRNNAGEAFSIARVWGVQQNPFNIAAKVVERKRVKSTNVSVRHVRHL